MYYSELLKIVGEILGGKVEKRTVMDYLMNNVDSVEIYDSDDMLLTDVYFTLIHYATGEEEVSRGEWIYFEECLSGEKEYSMEEKMHIAAYK